MLNGTIKTTAAASLLVALAGAPMTLAQQDVREQDRNREKLSHPDKPMKNTSGDATLMLQFARSDELLGTQVLGRDKKEIGELHDLIIDLDTGRATHALIETGGILDIGDKLAVVPMRMLRFHHGQDRFQATLDEAALKNMKEFQSEHWPSLYQGDFEQLLDRWFEVGEVEPMYREDLGRLIRMTDVQGLPVKAWREVTGEQPETRAPELEQIGEVGYAVIEGTTETMPFVVIQSGGFLGLNEGERLAPIESFYFNGEALVLEDIDIDEFELIPLEEAEISDIRALRVEADRVEFYELYSCQPRQFTVVIDDADGWESKKDTSDDNGDKSKDRNTNQNRDKSGNRGSE